MTITDRKNVSEAELFAVPDDFEPGDMVYIDLSSDSVIIGVIVDSTETEISVRRYSGIQTFNAYSDPPLSYVMRNIGKTPNLFDLQPGTIVSRISVDFNGENSREYAKVITYECGRGIMPYLIEVEFLDDETSPPEKLSYMTQYQCSIEEQMRYWTVEG